VVEHPLAQVGGERRRGRDLDDLLVPQLHGAVPVVEVDDVAVAIGEDLHLDVAGALEEPLDEQLAATERRHRLAAAALETPRPCRPVPRRRASPAHRPRQPP
jgi:hypothetical protein